jgi:uroporphyrinogen-III synthase
VRRLLILRPEPAATRTAQRALELGLDAVVSPIFELTACEWQPPKAGDFDAIIFTSANAARLGGGGLNGFSQLPCYAVGESTALAARDAGFTDVRTGPSDGAALLDLMARDGIGAAFHPCGRDHLPLEHPAIRIERQIVYAAHEKAVLPEGAVAALKVDALALIHSPRASQYFGGLVDAAGLAREAVEIAAISRAAAEAAGKGWKAMHMSPEPRDHALLELAAKLCKTGRLGMGSDA